MKKIRIFIAILFFLIIAALIYFAIRLKDTNKQSMLSPLPNFLTIFDNNEVSTINIWRPNLDNEVIADIKKPDVSAVSALVYDLTTNRVTFSKEPKRRLPMASLTKIMTAIIALENQKNDDRYLVTKEDLVGEDSMGLDAGEVLSLRQLLYGLILHSANDAAETLANNFSGGREKFIDAMNKKSKTLGLLSTNFTNPTGLEGDGRQYTTAYDLLVMTRFALLNFPVFDKVVSTFDYNIPQTDTHKAYSLENETNLLTSYPGVEGVKTGYTPEAGLCLVTYLNYDGHKVVGIILGSDNRRDEMKQLLDYSLRAEGIKPPNHG